MSEIVVKCKHCGQEPVFVKHCMMNCVYYNFRCSCKETPLIRNFLSAEKDWEEVYSQRHPNDMPKIKDENGSYFI